MHLVEVPSIIIKLLLIELNSKIFIAHHLVSERHVGESSFLEKQLVGHPHIPVLVLLLFVLSRVG